MVQAGIITVMLLFMLNLSGGSSSPNESTVITTGLLHRNNDDTLPPSLLAKTTTVTVKSVKLKSFTVYPSNFPITGQFSILQNNRTKPRTVLYTVTARFRSNSSIIAVCNITIKDTLESAQDTYEKRLAYWTFDFNGLRCNNKSVAFSNPDNRSISNPNLFIVFTSKFPKSTCLTDVTICDESHDFYVTADCTKRRDNLNLHNLRANSRRKRSNSRGIMFHPPPSDNCLINYELNSVDCCDQCHQWPTCLLSSVTTVSSLVTLPSSTTVVHHRDFPQPPAFPDEQFINNNNSNNALPEKTLAKKIFDVSTHNNYNNMTTTPLFLLSNDSDGVFSNESNNAYVNISTNDLENRLDKEIISLLSGTSASSTVVAGQNNLHNTSDTGCDSVPCLNNGTCHVLNARERETNTSYYCQCPKGYFGDRCQYVDTCYVDNAPCLNGGSCILLNETINFRNLTQNSKWMCVCLPGFNGPFCELRDSLTLAPTFNFRSPLFPLEQPTTDSFITSTISSSLPVTSTSVCPLNCLNGGHCVVTATATGTGNSSADTVRCLCPPEWRGGDPFCGNRTMQDAVVVTATSSITSSSTIVNNATCTTGGQNTCQHNGQCKNGGCDCAGTGYKGPFCETDVDECSALVSPCKFRQICVNTNGSYNCACTTGFAGQFCNETIKNAEQTGGETSSSKLGLIFGCIFGVLALIGLAVGGFFLYRYVNRSRKLKGKYNPAKEELNNVGGHPLPLSTLSTGERLI